MSTYIPTPSGVPLPSLAGVTLPDDGDQPDAGSVNVPIETLVDAVQYIQGKIDPANSIASGAQIVRRMVGVPVPGPNASVAYDATDFDYLGVSVTGTFKFAYLLDLPHGSNLRQIRVYVYRPGASTTISVIRRDYAVSTGGGGDIDELPVETVIGTSSTVTSLAGDTSYVASTFSGVEIDREDDCEYFVRVTGTAGGDTVFWTKCRMWIEFTGIDQGAA